MSKSASPHRLIQASAGSGKTFQLVNHLLRRLAEGAEPEQLLAMTFTRKAAGEILDSLLRRLAEAGLDGERCRELADHLEQPRLTARDCLDVLGRVIESFPGLRIGTLDSFFGYLAGVSSSPPTHRTYDRSFPPRASETGVGGRKFTLPPGWRIADEIEDRRLRAEALHEVLHGDRGRVADICRRLCKGHSSKSIEAVLVQVTDSGYSVFLETGPEAWQIELPAPVSKEDVGQARAILEHTDLPRTQSGEFSKKWVSAIEEHLANIDAGDWMSFVAKGIAAKVLAGEPAYANQEIPGDLRNAVRVLLRHAAAELITPIAEQTWASYELLAAFHECYWRLKRRRRAIRFDDVTTVLAVQARDGKLDGLLDRLDARIDGVFLDEFQDTSPPQWQALLPLVHRVASKGAEGRTFFCVGDAKQAIYGWRGGAAEILDDLSRQFPELTPVPLTKSYRSSPPVIQVVNEVFGKIADNPVLAPYLESVRRWAKDFETHTTQKTDLAGYVGMTVAPAAAEGEKQNRATWRFAADQVKRIADDAPDKTIGVLTRTNAAVGRLVQELNHPRRGLSASQEGGVPLTDSPAVTVMLSALQIADHPGDSVARFHVAHSPLGPAIGIPDDASDTQVRDASYRFRRELLENGYGPTLDHWTRLVREQCSDRDEARLGQLVELAYRYDSPSTPQRRGPGVSPAPRATLRPTDFIAVVENARVDDPRPSRIRVMTLHQAKGLEFEVVVLPELDVDLLGFPPRFVTDRLAPDQPIRKVCRHVNQAVQPLLPGALQAMFAAEVDRRLRESLCLLYVALTRAIHALHLIIGPPERNRLTFARVLRYALSPGVDPVPGAVLFEHGNVNWQASRSPGTSQGTGLPLFDGENRQDDPTRRAAGDS